jgi:YfiH family protein
VAQGCTGQGDPEDPFDLALFGAAAPARAVLRRWETLLRGTGFSRGVHARQVHGAAVRFHHGGEPGLLVAEPCDGHATADPDVLMAVTTADCVPVSIVDPLRPAVALVHAGWRGAAAGILQRGVAVLAERAASRPGDLHVHLGPCICGSCYEVGPEVFEALGLPRPHGPEPVDLRAALAERALAAGVSRANVTVSEHCTRCGEGFFSHRGGDAERQVGFLGLRR